MSNPIKKSLSKQSLSRLLSASISRHASNFDTSDSIDCGSSASLAAASKAKADKPTDASEEILSQSLALTDYIFGIYAIELWHFDASSGRLINVCLGSHDEETGQRSGALLIKRRTQETDPINDYSTTEAIDAFSLLTDTSHRDYIVPRPYPVGVGVPGVLWSEAHHGEGSGRHGLHFVGGSGSRSHDEKRTGIALHPFLSHRAGVRFGKRKDHHGLDFGIGSRSQHEKRTGFSLSRAGSGRGWFNTNHDNVLWRDVEELANDPDQSFDERLQAFAKAGFKLAAGIPFDINGYRGIVIYYGNPHATPEKLRNPINSRLMENTAQSIGTAAAIQQQMEEVKLYRKQVTHQNWRRVKVKILAVVRFGRKLRRADNGQVDDTSHSSCADSVIKRSTRIPLHEVSSRLQNDARQTLNEAHGTVKSRFTRWAKKIQGGDAGIPPSFTYRQCMWTFIGVMTTHTILSRINQLAKVESNNELSLVLAPLGALTTLQYNLTAAPASQPRNAIFAQIFAITTTIVLGYIPNIEPWFRSALAPAIVIPGMAKLGIIHPPAGAAAIVFSSENVRWEHFGIFLAGVAISIVTSVLINNLSDKRQYPTSWYLVSKANRAISKA